MRKIISLKSVNKSSISVVILSVLYFMSYFLPYGKALSASTFSYISRSGIEVISDNAVRYGVLALFLIIYMILRFKFPQYSIIFASFIFLYLFYLAVLPFLLPTGTPISVYSAIVVKILQIGYYVNSLLGLVLGIYLIRQSLKTR